MSEWMLIDYQHPDASPGATLTLPVLLLPNTPIEALSEYTRINSADPYTWLWSQPAHDRVAVIVGGGPSAADHVEQIRAETGDVFGLNASTKWLRRHGIEASWQVMCDAQRETATLVDKECRGHLFASSMHPLAVREVQDPIIWHPISDWVEDELPPDRRKKGGYALIGGGVAVGLSAICCAYALGYRTFHLYGYDSSHRDGEGHAYKQAMNDRLQVLPVRFGGRAYWATITMRAQAERFQILAQALQQEGCTIEVFGDGLLPDMWRVNSQPCAEREKYRRMWDVPHYRQTAPGENLIPVFLEIAKPDKGDEIIDFGCGTGRGGLALSEAGYQVLMIDFAANSRDQHTRHLPFLEWDLTLPIPARAPWGYCTDVMEHLPPEDVPTVISNIMDSVDRCFFQIATQPDAYGGLIGQDLHLTVETPDWWEATFKRLGFEVSNVHVVFKGDKPARLHFIAARTNG